MMIIDGHTIKNAIDNGMWKAYRNGERIFSHNLNIGSNSVDLTLGSKMLKPSINSRYKVIDVAGDDSDIQWKEFKPIKGKFLMQPGDFALASAQERFDVSAPISVKTSVQKVFDMSHPIAVEQDPPSTYVIVAPMFEGRSTMARLGLAMHVTAGFGDYGFDGHFTMELVNHGPLLLLLTVGMRIAQLSFQVVTPDAVHVKYNGAYIEKTNGPVPPVLGKNRFF